MREIFSKASKRLYILRVLKRSGIPPENLINIVYALVRSVLEYACVTWSTSLPIYLKDKIERVQKRALRTVFRALRCHCGCKLHSLKCEKRKTNSGRKSGTVSVCLGHGCTTSYHQSAPIAMLMSCATKIMYHSLNAGLKDLINLFFQQWRLTPSPCNQANLSVLFHWYIYTDSCNSQSL